MKNTLAAILSFQTILLFISSSVQSQNWKVEPISPLPEVVSNNAVCEGFVGDTAFAYSFGGIDASKQASGIHNRSFRYHTIKNEWIRIPDLPDERGKIASAASRIGGIIYIIGGYYVAANGLEESSDRVHRYDVVNNVYLSDGATIPVPIDDHVQAVWRDSLIYVVTGWSDVRNVPDVQIYDPTKDKWMIGTRLLNSSTYTSFGSSGTIVGDTVFYFGGATSSAANFPIQNTLRKGIINPNNPTEIEWSRFNLDNSVMGYRMACTAVFKEIHWIGGSGTTYNFDGIAYNGSGGVEPLNRDLYLNTQSNYEWQISFDNEFPMDMRGIASINDTLKYLAGGMSTNQTVTNQAYRLKWNAPISSTGTTISSSKFALFPNPTTDLLHYEVKHPNFQFIRLYNIYGQLLQEKKTLNGSFPLKNYPNGNYLISVITANGSYQKWVVKN